MTVVDHPAKLPKFDPAQDYYALLQVHPNAHVEVIKRAYHTILGILGAHPDLGGSHACATRLNEAYAVLSNPDARRAYDAARRQWMRRTEPPAPRRTVRCPHCGAKNRLPADIALTHALCGKCHGVLGE